MRNTIPFSIDPLDPNLVLAKPKHSISAKEISALEKNERLRLTRKRDGHRHPLVISGRGQSNVRLYTRTMHEATEKFPHIPKLFSSLGIPGNTILDTELVCETEPGVDHFEQVSRLANNPRTIEIQQEEGFARLVILNIVAYNNVMMMEEPFSDRYGEIMELFSRYEGLYEYVEPLQMLDMNFAAATETVVSRSWEGLVLYDVTKGTEYRLDGAHDKPPRPVGCWKWKPFFEEDFVATHFAYGNGRNKHRMGKIFISQRDPVTGEFFPCGEIGAWKDKQREHYANQSLYPFVIEVKYEKRFASGALGNGQFLRERPDKTVDECYRVN